MDLKLVLAIFQSIPSQSPFSGKDFSGFYRCSGCLFIVSLFISGCGHKAGGHDQMPEENRFRRVVLIEHLYNSMELEIAGDGNIYVIQTNGHLIKVNPLNRSTKLVGNIKNADNSEFGLIGMALDPNFSRNHWIYLHYFLPGLGYRLSLVSCYIPLREFYLYPTARQNAGNF